MARMVGFEPTTYRLTAGRSTTELHPHKNAEVKSSRHRLPFTFVTHTVQEPLSLCRFVSRQRFGRGGRIRTYECSSQSAVSYRLTTPPYLGDCHF